MLIPRITKQTHPEAACARKRPKIYRRCYSILRGKIFRRNVYRLHAKCMHRADVRRLFGGGGAEREKPRVDFVFRVDFTTIASPLVSDEMEKVLS